MFELSRSILLDLLKSIFMNYFENIGQQLFLIWQEYLQLPSCSCILAPVIQAHLPIDQAGRSYCSDRRMFENMVASIQ
jgi:hypothetical protein